MRAVALLLVVLIHASPWPSRTGVGAAFYSGLALLSRPALPLFVMLSGILLGPGLRPAEERPGFWGRRLRRTLLPWLPWAGIYFAIDVLFTGMPAAPAASWGWWAGGAGHLYFLLLIPQLYLLLPLWPGSRRGRGLALAAALLVQLGSQLLRVTAQLPGPGNTLLLSYGFELAPLWVGYFALGLWLSPHLARPGRWRVPWPLLVLGLVAGSALLLWGPVGLLARHWGPWVGGTGAFLRPELLPLGLVLLLALWRLGGALEGRLGGRSEAALRSLSRHSLGVYIVHPALLLGLGAALNWTPRPLSLDEPWPLSLLPFALLVALALAGGWGLTSVLAARPWTRWAMGEG